MLCLVGLGFHNSSSPRAGVGEWSCRAMGSWGGTAAKTTLLWGVEQRASLRAALSSCLGQGQRKQHVVLCEH